MADDKALQGFFICNQNKASGPTSRLTCASQPVAQAKLHCRQMQTPQIDEKQLVAAAAHCQCFSIEYQTALQAKGKNLFPST